jgi:hypothetical protein
MNRLYTLKWGWALALYGLLDLFCVGMGMGVPLFNILLGLIVGWYAARRVTAAPRVDLTATTLREILRRVLVYAGVASGGTFLLMAAMMIVLSPFLQFLMALLGAHLTLLC